MYSRVMQERPLFPEQTLFQEKTSCTALRAQGFCFILSVRTSLTRAVTQTRISSFALALSSVLYGDAISLAAEEKRSQHFTEGVGLTHEPQVRWVRAIDRPQIVAGIVKEFFT